MSAVTAPPGRLRGTHTDRRGRTVRWDAIASPDRSGTYEWRIELPDGLPLHLTAYPRLTDDAGVDLVPDDVAAAIDRAGDDRFPSSSVA